LCVTIQYDLNSSKTVICVGDRAVAQEGAACCQVLAHGREHGHRQVVALEQMAEVRRRRGNNLFGVRWLG